MEAPKARTARVIAIVLIAWSTAAIAHADALTDDLKARRARVMARLGADAMLVLHSAPIQRYSLDVNYEYRQDSNLYYLTGIVQADTLLVLMPGNASRREILFIKAKDPAQEHFRGRTLSEQEARARSGIDLVLTTNQFEPFVSAMLTRTTTGSVTEQDAARFFEALAVNRAQLFLALEPDRTLGGPLTPSLAFAQRVRDRFVGFQVMDASPILADFRLIKTPYERSILVKSLEISSDAQITGMRTARPGAFEYEVKAAIEAVHRGRGAVSASYPSIVGSGPNATILHYPESGRQMQAGDLLLVDAACNYEYASGDITRTYPVGGKFSAVQRDIYELVLQAQTEGMTVAKNGGSLTDIHQRTVDAIKKGLLRLGLITDTTGEQYRLWFTHSAVHYIGIDVHDVGDKNRPLRVGMAFVIEPGIYVRQSALDALPATAENAALIEKVQEAVRRYEGIGVRIEDSFLVDESGLRRLSSSVPRTIEEVETFMSRRASGSATAR